MNPHNQDEFDDLEDLDDQQIFPEDIDDLEVSYDDEDEISDDPERGSRIDSAVIFDDCRG